jgi:AcrR family transcriptional regulator
VIAGEDLPVEHVDLEITDTQARHELSGLAVGPADDRACARDQIVRNEWHTDVVIGTALEGIELSAKVASASQCDDADRPTGPRFVDELDTRAGLEVDVEKKEVRLPFGDRGLGGFDARFRAPEIASVAQGEVDRVRERAVFDHQEHAHRALGVLRGGGGQPRRHPLSFYSERIGHKLLQLSVTLRNIVLELAMPNLNTSAITSASRPGTIRGRSDSFRRLLDGAETTFAERGYNAATIHDICARAGVGIGTFYTHFGRKSELLRQVMVVRAPVLSRILTTKDLGDAELLAAGLRKTVDDPRSVGLWRAWHDAVLQESDIARFHTDWRRAVRDELTAMIEQARAAKPRQGRWMDAKFVAWTMMTLARELAIHDRTGGAADVETAAELISQLVSGPTRSSA